MKSSTSNSDTSIERIRGWLTERIALYLVIPEENVPPEAVLIELGLDSVYTMALSGDIEERFGLVIETTAAWDHSTVNGLAAAIDEGLGDR